jgi:carboxyl-terminal processing protease
MRKASLVLLGAAAGLALTMVATQPRLAARSADTKPVATQANYRVLDLFGDVFARVRASYVETPDDDKLIASAIDGMLSSLENSSYVDSKSSGGGQAVTGPGSELGGVGVEVTMEEGLVLVVAATDDTPAAKAGIMARDIITQINGAPVDGLTFRQVVDRLAGRAGTELQLTIVHPGQDKSVEVSLVRGTTTTQWVRARAEGGDIGYIRVTQFNERTPAQLKKAIGEVTAQIAPEALKGYVLDLRNNPGGQLDPAISVADAFLEEGEIVSIRGRETEERHFRATAGDLAHGKPLIVLINAGSASEAEVVAGALRDHKRATVVGTRSFGMGSVKTSIPLGSGSGGQANGAIRLTTGHYFTPSGRLIKGNGISPDVEALQDIPDDLKVAAPNRNQQPALQAYIPPDAKNDKALNLAYDLLRKPTAAAASRPAKTVLPN